MPVAAGTPIDPARTRTRVLDAATELFYARGIHAVGVDEITRTAGVSKLSLYRNFGSKDRLVEEVLDARSDRIHAWLAASVEQTRAQTSAGRVLAVFDALAAWYAEPGFRGCAIVNAATDTRGERGAIPAIAQRHLTRYQNLFETELAAMGAADPTGVARQLLVVLEGATTMAAIEGTPDAGRHARTMAEVILGAA